jgi:DNA transformation protein
LLARVGIATVAELRRIGSVGAYVRAKSTDPKASLNLLWGLEATLTGESWRQIAKTHRASLLLALEEYQRNTDGSRRTAGLAVTRGCRGTSSRRR